MINKIVNEDNNDNDNDNDDDDDDKITVKEINNNFKEIDETKSFDYRYIIISFDYQIDILKKISWLSDYWNMFYYEDNKEKNLRLFKWKFAHAFNDVDDNLFKEIFGHTSVKLADKLINTTSKEENH